MLFKKRILVRVDLNVPVHDGKILDEHKIHLIQPTINYLLKQKAKIILISHFKRPKGKYHKELSVKFLIPTLEKAFQHKVHFLDDIEYRLPVENTDYPAIFLLENIRFYEGEEKNDFKFAYKLLKLGDIFVNEAFATSHRHHSSIYQLPQILPAYHGIALMEEIKTLNQILKSLTKPILFVVGGKKFISKFKFIKMLSSKADKIFTGGRIALPFLKIQNKNILLTKEEEELIPELENFLNKGKVTLPFDIINQNKEAVSIESLKPEDEILDIGPKTIAHLTDILPQFNTIIWNGPLGKIEDPDFEKGSQAFCNLLKTKKNIIVGGGDTISLVEKNQLTVSHASTAGGALIAYLAYSGHLKPLDFLKHYLT